MLNQGKYISTLFLLTLLYSCNNNQRISLIERSKMQIGSQEYLNIYKKAADSINIWTTNKLGYYQYCGKSKNCFLDSLICFNADKTRFIGCLLKQQLLTTAVADDIDYFYGVKINNEWFFFSGENIFVPREMIENHPIDKPLSYQQLHQIALKEVYGGYLKRNGGINELWFTELFEGPQYGDFNNQAASDWYLKGRRFKTKKEYYEFSHLQKVRNNWGGVNRDSIKQLPAKNNLP